MWNDIKGVYTSAWAFAWACPLLFLVPVLVEFAQHVVEMQAGMYVDEAGAIAAEADPLRLQFGFVKTLALLLPGYWHVRFIMYGHDAARARALEWPAVGLFAVIFALSGVQSWLGLFAPSLGEWLGFAGGAATVFATAQAIVLQVVSIYLFAWFIAWPLGNASFGPVRSFKVMHGSFWYAVGLFIAAFLPLMILHYGLSALAILTGGPALDWAVLALDAVVVGFLALNLAGATAYAARHAANRKNVALLPEQTVAV